MAEPRAVVNLRISKTGLDAVDKIAKREARTRSDAMRIMLAYATQNMPKGWAG